MKSEERIKLELELYELLLEENWRDRDYGNANINDLYISRLKWVLSGGKDHIRTTKKLIKTLKKRLNK